MNKVLEGIVSVYRGPAVKSHRAEASHLMEEGRVRVAGVTSGLVERGLH